MALRSRAVSGTCRDSFRCTRCALISITVLRKRKRRLARSESRFGSIAVRFSIQRRRWRAAPVRIRSTRRAPANVNDARARDANAKVDLTAGDLAVTTSRTRITRIGRINHVDAEES